MAAATVTHQPDLLQLRNQPQASLRQPSLTNSSSRPPNLAMATFRQCSNAIRNKARGQKSSQTPSSGKTGQDSNEEKKSKRFDRSYPSQNEELRSRKSTQTRQPNRDITITSTMSAKPKRFFKNKRYSSSKAENNNCELKVVNKQPSATQITQLQPPTSPLPVDSTHTPLTTQPHLKCSISVDSGRGDDISSSCESSVVSEQGQVQTPNKTSSCPQLLDSILSENENSPGEDDVFMDALSNLGSDSEDDDEFVTPLASRSPSLSHLSPSYALNDSLMSSCTAENPDPSTLTDIVNKSLQQYGTGILQDDSIPVPPSPIPKSICDSPTPVLPRSNSNDSGMYEGQSNEESSLGPLSSLGTCLSHENSPKIPFFIGNNDQTLDSIPQIEIEDKKTDAHSQNESESQMGKESFNETGNITPNQLPDLLNVPHSTSKSCNTSFDSADLVLSHSSDSGITSSPTSSSPSPSHSQSPNPENKSSSGISMSHNKLVTSLRNPRLASESDIISLLAAEKDEPSSVLKQRKPCSTLKSAEQSKQHQSMTNSASTPDMSVDGTSSIDHSIHSLSFHPLNSIWVLWYDKLTTKRPQFTNYAASLERLAVMNSVEEFWGVYNNLLQPSELEQNANYHFFKKGIRPLWEDKANKHGGKWVFTFKSNSHLLDKTWMEILMALVGEHVEKSHLINGAVLSRRKKGDRIAVWTADKGNKPGNLHICKQLIQVLCLACDVEEAKYSEFVHKLAEDKEGISMVYMHHDDSLRSKTSYQNEAHLTLRKNLQFVLDDQ